MKKDETQPFCSKAKLWHVLAWPRCCYRKWSQPAYPPNKQHLIRDQWVGGLRWFSPYRAVINLNERHKSRWYPSKNTLYTLVIRNFTTSQYGEEKRNTTFLLKDQALTCLGRSGEIMEAAEFRLKSGVFHVWHASAWAFVRPNNYQYLIYIIGHLFQTLG